ncbi:DEAD/DEAH box helicase [Corynebacterium sp. 320]|uniref:DEAD/DEAH box helicase n=1 Tax=Corynebacterium TaxID=1716 RepID=UPI00125CB53B|nr:MULTISPECIES: DEAD/DEAH box helicase [Corynebacterium]KAB1503861.1 DEAD/DEAH box helicase [Corynebacterium sp. 320]KAB3527997.1 DEAD/DEAH box helicase [Corynebacterium sp. 250]QNP91538.1 DEAD/DEAH box helicase [Corynebacterium zhongnanshanii]
MSSLIPTHAADYIVDGLSEYLTTTFALSEDLTAQQLRDFLLAPEGGMFYGPYVRTRLPYAPASDWSGILGWLPDYFKPYRHQAEAFARLRSVDVTTGEDHRPQPTLVVTGTGSGKTESFLYPILDHCRRTQGSGIKALILYPMNALASDQERRLAELISSEAALAGVSAGLYTGEVPTGGRRKISENGLITDRSVMRDTPPDILLTNYKMLDQLLLRPADRSMWEKSATSLQYLVLDEFHTYDAAQGTDVAMLLRRLGLMLKRFQPAGFLSENEAARPLGRVTPVATSATLGGTAGESTDMVDFAFTVFGERLSADAVVGETLLSVDQWVETIPELVGEEVEPTPTPTVEQMQDVVDRVNESTTAGSVDYDVAVHEALSVSVFGATSPLGVAAAIAAMAGNELVHNILREAATPVPLVAGEHGVPGQERVQPLVERVFSASVLRNHGALAAEFLAIILAEMAHLRAQFGAMRGWEGKKIPGVETHLWVREISRIDRAVGAGAGSMFRWSDDNGLNGASAVAQGAGVVSHAWLPAIYCRHCGRSGWMFAVQPGGDTYVTAPQEIRKLSIGARERLRPLIDATSEVAQEVLRTEDDRSRVRWLNLEKSRLEDAALDEETIEESPVVPVLTYAGEDIEERAKEQECPSCGERDAIRYLGSSVATLLSVALSNVFGMDSLSSAEKKTLVFADSVQDAAHRAGFVENRARAFALRSRMWRAVRGLIAESQESSSDDDATTSSGEIGVRLDRIAEQMVGHALAESDPLMQSRALFELLPPQLKKSSRYRAVWEDGATKTQRDCALESLRKRLGIDLALEFGDRVDLPRSMVTTGTLSVAVDVPDSVLLEAAQAAADTLSTDEELLGWARGIVEFMRIRGGIDHPWFQEYLRHDCNPWRLNRREARARGIPAFGRGEAPHFPRAGTALKGAIAKRDNSATMSLGSQKGWYARWTKKALGASSGSAFDAANQVTALFQQLKDAEVVRSVPTATGGHVYALAPSMIVVREEPQPKLLECPACHLRVGVDAGARAALTGVSCFTAGCDGHFTQVQVEDNYYQRLYRSVNTRTVVAAEHTGLVHRDKRNKIEKQFKMAVSEQPADAPNVLVATPTLEMGIDIGDLSTVMLSSMPRSVASYVQRVGRAGRLSGNSLIVALVRGRGTALGKLEHPLETIGGSVTAPAAYLSAREIMHRQFLAYVLESTAVLEETAELTNARDVFSSSGGALVNVLEETALQGLKEAVDRFVATLSEHTTDDVIEELRAWALAGTSDAHGQNAQGYGLVAEVQHARKRWEDTNRLLGERKFVLEQRMGELDLKAEHAGAEDDELRNKRDATAVSLRFVTAQQNEHTKEYWISAMERYGLLPNFTLLDDTVEFELAVSSFNEDIQQFEMEKLTYNRGVSSALTELAPGNTFYVQGVGAQVDSVHLGEHHSAITQWRLCPECSYSEATGAVLSADEAAAVDAPMVGQCPACGSHSFADRDQLIDVVEMTKVYATVDAARSAISDFADDRASQRYQTQLSFSVPEGGRGAAWYLSGSGFGIEYLPHAQLRWLNLGRMGGGAKRMLAGQEKESPLFRVCEHCGHLDSEAGSNSWRDHAAWCKHRDAHEEHSLTFALGRTLGTQGVLVHLPALLSMVEATTVPSLIAALKLGFKEYLGGNPDHLDVEAVRVESDGIPVDMLLIHDTVPGGTGYLAQFTDPDNVRGLLEVAYRRLRTCHCSDEDRGCCPSCLLPFAQSSHISMTSRAAAVVALSKILSDDMHLPVDADPLAISWDRHITQHKPEHTTQSKLELRFVEQLREDLKAMNAIVSEAMHGNYAHWTINFPGSPHVWIMREQVNLGVTVPDILFSTADPDIRDIALYLDGAAFHVSEAHNRVKDDFDKRNALFSQGYLPWTLTWGDIDARKAVVANEPQPRPVWEDPCVREAIHRTSKGSDLSDEKAAFIYGDPMTLLLHVLLAPTFSWRDGAAQALVVAAWRGRQVGRQREITYLDAVTMRFGRPKNTLTFDASKVGQDVDAWKLFVTLSNLVYLSGRNNSEVVVHESAAEQQAIEVLRTPESEPVTATRTGGLGVQEPAELTGVWQEAAQEFDDEPGVIKALRALAASGLPVPAPDSVGEELAGIPAVVHWPKAKVVLALTEDAEDLRSELAAKGYLVVAAEFDAVPNELSSALNEN